MDRYARQRLVASVAAEFQVTADTTYQELARQLGAVWTNRAQRRVAIRFTRLPHSHITGATALLADGSYLVICAASPRWYFRLQVLLHEFAHDLLGHEHITLDRGAGLQLLVPTLLPKMARFVAGRTTFTAAEEDEAETVADELFAVLTEDRVVSESTAPGLENLRRLRETLEH
ncbi:hypothetical protein [Kutzneria sp. 744]|uniref:hypothetical protein n=1 Tax=Kutzneria sp. (strain 744) TaxID=345341 RepID=UPI0003EEBBCB|nr:hypothetical protein [Kutzneria sp. 744]EWM14537.1 hypothetical protein KUTG_04841 [Kutzneria sp. 744]